MSHTYLPIWGSYHRGPTLEPWASAVGQDLTDFMGDVVKTCYNMVKAILGTVPFKSPRVEVGKLVKTCKDNGFQQLITFTDPMIEG